MLKFPYRFLAAVLICSLAVACNQASPPVSTRNINSIQSIKDSIKLVNTSLNLNNKKALKIRREIAKISKKYSMAEAVPDKKQQEIYKAITPYLSNAGLGYQLIPASFPIDDTLVSQLVQRFNQAESVKQHLLSGQPDSSLLNAANDKIITLRDTLLAAMNGKKVLPVNLNSKNVLEDSLAAVKETISKEALVYANLNQELQHLPKDRVTNIRSIDRRSTGDNFSKGSIYIIVCLAGLLLLVGAIYFARSYWKIVSVPTPVNEAVDDKVFGTMTDDDIGLQQIAEKIKKRVAGKNKTLLVTSLTDNMDKSAVCQRLALYLSKIRIRVVIVNLNFDEDQFGDWNNSNDLGIKDFIFNKVDRVEEMIISTRNPGVSIIARGRDYFNVVQSFIGNTHFGLDAIDQNQKKLIFNSPKLAFITEKLSQKFGCVMLHATALNDPAAVLPLTDLTVLNLVAMANSLDKEQQMDQVAQLTQKYHINDSSILLID